MKLTLFAKLVFVGGAILLYGCVKSPESILVDAAATGDEDKVLEYLKIVSSVDEAENDGWTALTVASREGHVHVVKVLLDNGADINVLEAEQKDPKED